MAMQCTISSANEPFHKSQSPSCKKKQAGHFRKFRAGLDNLDKYVAMSSSATAMFMMISNNNRLCSVQEAGGAEDKNTYVHTNITI